MSDNISKLLEEFIAEKSAYHEKRENFERGASMTGGPFHNAKEGIESNSRRVNLDLIHDASKPESSQNVLWCRFLRITTQAGVLAVEKAQSARGDLFNAEHKRDNPRESDVWLLSRRTKPRIVRSLEFNGVVGHVNIDFQPLFDLDSSMSFFASGVSDHQGAKRCPYEEFSSCKVAQREKSSILSVSNLHEIHLSERKLAYDSAMSEDHLSDFKASRESLVSRLKSETRAVFGQILHITAILLQDFSAWIQHKPCRLAVAHSVLSDAFSIECTSKLTKNHEKSHIPAILSKKHFSEETEITSRKTLLQHPDLMCCSKLITLGITGQLQNTSMMELLHLTTLIEKRWQGTPGEMYHSISQTNERPAQASFKSQMKWDPVIISVLFAYALSPPVDEKQHRETNQVMVRCICNGEYPTTSEAYAKVMDKYPIASSNIGDSLTMCVTIFVLGLRNISHPDPVISGLFHHIIFHTGQSKPVVVSDATPKTKRMQNLTSFAYLKYFQDFENAFPEKDSGRERVASFKNIFSDLFLKLITSLSYGGMFFRCDPCAFPWEKHREIILGLCGARTTPRLVLFIESLISQQELTKPTNQVDVMLLSMMQPRDVSHLTHDVQFQWSRWLPIVTYGLSFSMSNSIVLAITLVFPFCGNLVQDRIRTQPLSEETIVRDSMPPSEVFMRFLFSHFIMWDALELRKSGASLYEHGSSEFTWRKILRSVEMQFSFPDKDTYRFSTALAQQSARYLALSVKMSATCDLTLKKRLLKDLHSLLFTADPLTVSLHKEATQQAFFMNVISLSLVTMGSSDADVLGIVRALEKYDTLMMQREFSDLSKEERHYVDLFIASPNFRAIYDHNFAYVKDHYCAYTETLQKATIHRENHLHILLSLIVHLFLDITFADLSLLAPFMRLFLGCMCIATSPPEYAE